MINKNQNSEIPENKNKPKIKEYIKKQLNHFASSVKNILLLDKDNKNIEEELNNTLQNENIKCFLNKFGPELTLEILKEIDLGFFKDLKTEIIKYLFEKIGLNFSVKDLKDKNILTIFRYGKIEIIKFFFEKSGLNFSVEDLKNENISEIFNSGNIEIIKYFFEKSGLKFSIEDLKNENILKIFNSGDIETIKYFFEESGLKFSIEDLKNKNISIIFTYLYSRIRYFLKETGLEFSVEDLKNRNILEFFIFSKIEIVKYFFENSGLDFSVEDLKNINILHLFSYGQIEIIKYFFKNSGLDFSIEDLENENIFNIFRDSDIEVIKFFFKNSGLNFSIEDLKNENIFKIFEYGDIKVIKFFFKNSGLNFSIEDLKNENIFNIFRDGDIEVIKFFFKNSGLDFSIEDLKNENIFNIFRDGNVEIIKFFFKNSGLDFSIEDLKNENIFKIFRGGEIEIIKYFFKKIGLAFSIEDLENENILEFLLSFIEEDLFFIKDIKFNTKEEFLKKFGEIYNVLEHINQNELYSLKILINKVNNIDLMNFIKQKILGNRKIENLLYISKIPGNKENLELLKYIFENKKKSFIDIIKLLDENYRFNLGLDTSLFGLKPEKLKKEIKNYFENKETNSEIKAIIDKLTDKEKNQLQNGSKNNNFSILFNKKIEILKEDFYKNFQEKIKQEFSIQDNDINIEKIENSDFIEAYKICQNPKYNGNLGRNLLKKYLNGEFDDIYQVNQFNTENNKRWLKDNLNEEQQKIWLSENRKEIKIYEEDKGFDNSKIKIKDFFSISIEKINKINENCDLNLKNNFKNYLELIEYFEKEINPKKEKIKEKDTENLFEDLELQIKNIKENLKIGDNFIDKENIFEKYKNILNQIKDLSINGFERLEKTEDFELFTQNINSYLGKITEFIQKNIKNNNQIADEIKEKINSELKDFIEINKKLKKNIKNTDLNKKSNSKIIIKKELDPIKVMMMGNWVEGSCLSYYSNIGNYFSAISNASDVNKGVFYIYDEKDNLLGRVIVTIGNDKKLTRYKMYFGKGTNINLNEHFNNYFKELAKKMGLEINGDENKVENIECEIWYKDGEYFVE